MPELVVRFKGMLTKNGRERLEQAGIAVEGKERSMRVGVVKTGRPIFTVRVEATSEEEALQKVREALEPDTANFSNWQAVPPR